MENVTALQGLHACPHPSRNGGVAMTTIEALEHERFNVNLTDLYERERSSLGTVWTPTTDQLELMRQEMDADRLIRARIAREQRKQQRETTWLQKLQDKGYPIPGGPLTLKEAG